MAQVEIDEARCEECGLCAEFCPMGIPRKFEEPAGRVEVAPDRAEHCMACGHCMAICPTRSIGARG